MFEEGNWVIDSSEEYGFISEVKENNTCLVVFPHNGRIATRFVSELKLAPIQTSYNYYNVHVLQTLAVNTKDREWFTELINNTIEGAGE